MESFISDASCPFDYSQPTQIIYDELETSFHIGGVYIEAYLNNMEAQFPIDTDHFIRALTVIIIVVIIYYNYLLR